MGIGRVSQKKLHLLVPHFPPLIVTTSPVGGETGSLQTVVSVAMCYFPGHNSVADGAGMVASVGVSLQNPVGAASRIVPC